MTRDPTTAIASAAIARKKGIRHQGKKATWRVGSMKMLLGIALLHS
jgi:hypothetical protein